MRKILFGSLLALLPSFAYADSTVSGQWLVALDANKQVEMDILADGHWYSQNIQDNKVVRRLSGTYEQMKTSANKGTLSFTPTKNETDTGKAVVETDIYLLSENHDKLSLINNGDRIDYNKLNLN